MRLLLSSYSLEPFPLEEIFLLGREIGADGLELVLTPEVFKLGLAKVKALAETHQFPVVNIHQPPWYVLFTGQGLMKKMIDQAVFFRAENLVAHLATMRRTFDSPFFEWIKGLESNQNINIAFENAAPRKLERWPSYAGSPEKLEEFVQKRKVDLTLDVAKAVLAGIDPYQFFQRNREQIKVIHIHGFTHKGDFHVGCTGQEFDWLGFMSFVKKFNYLGTVTLEIFPLHKWFRFNLPPSQKLNEAKEIITENFQLLKRA